MRANNSHSGVSMRLLLLNNNPAVSRLIKLSAEKAGHELDEFDDYGLVPLSSYDVILVDNELYDESALNELKENIGCDYCIYICQRGAQKPEYVNVSLEKPFLPTDFLVLLEKVSNVLSSQKEEVDDLSLDEEEEDDKHFDIDQIDALETTEEESPLVNEDNDNEAFLPHDEEQHEFDNIKFEDELLDEAVAMDEEIENVALKEDVFSLENESKGELEDFNFDLEEDEPKVREDDLVFDDVVPCVLDKDDIDEVKQLLDESDEEEIPEDSLSFLDDDFKETKEFLLDDANEKEELEEDKLEDIREDTLEWKLPKESLEEPFEETPIEDEALEFEMSLTDETDETDETLADAPFVGEADDIQAGIDSLDDLSENLIKKAFGEECAEEEKSVVALASPCQQEEEIEVIRGEIEKSISRSISSFAQSDILREALRGMRINISISFDENEAK